MVVTLICFTAMAQATHFEAVKKSAAWKIVLKDKGNKRWSNNWTLDGLKAEITNSNKGMHFAAGPEVKNDAHHAVLWTKKAFAGDIKVEFDYIRTDNENRWVNIIYIQATGTGKFDSDIAKWAKERTEPAMKLYFENMNALHISYAAFGNDGDGTYYIRARRYPKAAGKPFADTELPPSYDQKGFFKPNQVYHITVIKTNDEAFFSMESKDGIETFNWDLSNVEQLSPGKIGLRHMYGRSALYKNIKVYTR